MRRVLFCRSIYPTADHITEANHHLFELEDDCLFKSMDSLMIFSRNVAPISQNVYKHHYFLTSRKLFYVGLHVVNRSRKTIKLRKKILIKKFATATQNKIQFKRCHSQRCVSCRNRFDR